MDSVGLDVTTVVEQIFQWLDAFKVWAYVALAGGMLGSVIGILWTTFAGKED
jgi:hypothetical protein